MNICRMIITSYDNHFIIWSDNYSNSIFRGPGQLDKRGLRESTEFPKASLVSTCLRINLDVTLRKRLCLTHLAEMVNVAQQESESDCNDSTQPHVPTRTLSQIRYNVVQWHRMAQEQDGTSIFHSQTPELLRAIAKRWKGFQAKHGYVLAAWLESVGLWQPIGPSQNFERYLLW